MNIPNTFSVRGVIKYSLLTLVCLSWRSFAAEDENKIHQIGLLYSPNSIFSVHFRFTPDQGIEYKVDAHRNNQTAQVIGWSALGMRLQTDRAKGVSVAQVATDLSAELSLLRTTATSGQDNYHMLTGKQKNNRADFNQQVLVLESQIDGTAFNIEFRAYNDGIAFRYVLPQQSDLYTRVASESTTFNVGTAAEHWGQPYDEVSVYQPAYETFYKRFPAGTSATEKTNGTGWGFPSLYKTAEFWLLLHETNLDQNFHGSHLAPDAPKGVYRIAAPLQDEVLGLGSHQPSSVTPWQMPWRMIIIGTQLRTIFESNLVHHLAAPSAIEDKSWIMPGAASWSWWSDHSSSNDAEKLKQFIDLASAMHWPFALIDANWNTIGKSAMRELVEYANPRKVGLLFWYNSGGPHNVVTEQPRNLMDKRKIRQREFARIRSLGVKGVKIDFFQSDKQFIIKQYLEILEDAATEQLMVVFHGSTVPRGWQRTWPNLMSMESVRGAEFYTFSQQYGLMAPEHNTILPFTRNVVGSMDYTPVTYSAAAANRLTSDAHETALAIVFESGIQHLADNAETFNALPSRYKSLFKNLPAAWDESRLLHGAPGEDAVVARRAGTRWYIAGINGQKTAKKWTLNLNRLALSARNATLFFDDNKSGLSSSKVIIPQDDIFIVSVLPYGGFVLEIR